MVSNLLRRRRGSSRPDAGRRGASGSAELGVIVVSAALVLGSVFGRGVADTVVSVADGLTWLGDGTRGEIVRVNPELGRPDLRLDVADPGADLSIYQRDDVVVVVDRTTGEVRTLDLAQLALSAAREVSPGGAVDVLLATDGAVYVADRDEGTIARVDLVSATTIGQVWRAPDGLVAAAIDGTDAVWALAPDGTLTQLRWSAGADRLVAEGERTVDGVGSAGVLTGHDEGVTVFGPDSGVVVQEGTGRSLAGVSADLTGQVRAPARSPADLVPAAVESTGTVVLVTAGEVLAVGVDRIGCDRPGGPEVLESRVYVPCLGAGRVVVLGPDGRRAGEDIVTPGDGDPELVLDDGRLFVHVPGADRGVVVEPDGSTRVIRTADPELPTSAPSDPVPSTPTPSTPPDADPPRTPDTPDVPERPRVPDVPDTPRTPDTTETPQTPRAPNAPSTSGTPPLGPIVTTPPQGAGANPPGVGTPSLPAGPGQDGNWGDPGGQDPTDPDPTDPDPTDPDPTDPDPTDPDPTDPDDPGPTEPELEVPTAPTGVAVSFVSRNASQLVVRVSWDPAPSAQEVTAANVSAQGSFAGGTVSRSVTGTSADLTIPCAGSTWCDGGSATIRVRATNAAGTGPASQATYQADPEVPDPPALTAPTGVSAAAESNGTVRVTWTPGEAAEGHRVERTDTGATVASVGASATQAIVSDGISVGETVAFRVVAVRGSDTAPSGATSSVTVHTAPGGPGSVSVAMASRTETQAVVDVGWGAAAANGSPVSRYDITVTTSGGASRTAQTSGLSTQVTVPCTDFCHQETVTATVTATNAAGTGSGTSGSTTLASSPMPKGTAMSVSPPYVEPDPMNPGHGGTIVSGEATITGAEWRAFDGTCVMSVNWGSDQTVPCDGGGVTIHGQACEPWSVTVTAIHASGATVSQYADGQVPQIPGQQCP